MERGLHPKPSLFFVKHRKPFGGFFLKLYLCSVKKMRKVKVADGDTYRFIY